MPFYFSLEFMAVTRDRENKFNNLFVGEGTTGLAWFF